jgi:hypothetical protein
MYTLFTTTALLAATATASMQKWDTSCGSKYDRISTETLTMTSADGKFAAGSLVTIDSSGVTNLHGKFMGGSWSVRVYEEGASKPVGDFFGDLSKVLTFPDAKNTSFKIDGLTFALPEQQYSGKFQASFTATDFSHATYFCVDIFYGLDNAATVGAPNLLAAPQLVLPTFAPNQDPYTVTTQPGNFTVSSVQMTTRNGKFEPHYVATVVVKGVCEAEIDAGAVKYQMYETGVTSFIASGNSNYFDCDNKGCDRTKPIALKLTDTSGGFPTDYELTFSFVLPQRHSGGTKEFRLVFWGTDQHHSPYDFSATVTFNSRH